MDIVLILKYIGIAVGALDMVAGAVPDKYAGWHSIVFRGAKALHEFGNDEIKR